MYALRKSICKLSQIFIFSCNLYRGHRSFCTVLEISSHLPAASTGSILINYIHLNSVTIKWTCKSRFNFEVSKSVTRTHNNNPDCPLSFIICRSARAHLARSCDVTLIWWCAWMMDGLLGRAWRESLPNHKHFLRKPEKSSKAHLQSAWCIKRDVSGWEQASLADRHITPAAQALLPRSLFSYRVLSTDVSCAAQELQHHPRTSGAIQDGSSCLPLVRKQKRRSVFFRLLSAGSWLKTQKP